MKKLQLKINETIVWVVIDQLRVYSSDKMILNTRDRFLCYFNYSEPSLIYGELFLNSKGTPILFDSEQSAIDYASSELAKRIK